MNDVSHSGKPDIYVPTEAAETSLEHFEKLSKVVPAILYIYDLQNKRNVWVNRSIYNFLGYSETDVAEMGSLFLEQLMHPDDMERYSNHFERLTKLSAREIVHFEYRMRHKEGDWRWLASEETVYARDADNGVSQIVGSAHDVTEARSREESGVLFGREMKHRVKNLFSVVSSMISLTGRSQSQASAEDVLEIVRGRVNALAAAHTGSLGEESDDVQMLSDLMALILQPYFDDHDIKVYGTDPTITQNEATAIGLMLHELATNAVKHGALSQKDGRIEIHVADAEQAGETRFTLTWIEICPQPILPPEDHNKIGFGGVLIDRTAQQVGGVLARKWSPEGLTVTLEVPKT